MPWPVSLTKSSTAADRDVEARADGQPARRAAAHRLLGVQDQIEQRLLQLAAVGNHRRQPRVELGHELDAAQPELVGAQRQHALHEIGDVLRRPRRGLPSRKRQQVADDARRALRLLGDAPQVVSDLLARPRRLARAQSRSRAAARSR